MGGTNRSVAKWKDRGEQIGLNAARYISVPAANMLVAWLVIRYNSAETWGSFVPELILIQLSIHFLAWGNKEYLLRSFSKEPAGAANKWSSVLLTRLVFIVVPIVLILVLYQSWTFRLWTMLWLAAAFLHNALDVVVLHTRGFRLAVFAELAALAALLTLLLFDGTSINEVQLISAFAIAACVRAVLTLPVVRKLGRRSTKPGVDLSYFAAALPFFLIVFSGLLHSKIDLYLVNFFLPKDEVAIYQVLLSMFIFVQTISHFILNPFVRNLYRMDRSHFRKISRKLMKLGFFLCIASIVGYKLLITLFYHTDLPWAIFLLGGLYSFPIFMYAPYNYLMYKEGKEKKLMIMFFWGAAVNGVLTLALLPYLGMIGALAGGTISQYFLLFWFEIERRKIPLV